MLYLYYPENGWKQSRKAEVLKSEMLALERAHQSINVTVPLYHPPEAQRSEVPWWRPRCYSVWLREKNPAALASIWLPFCVIMSPCLLLGTLLSALPPQWTIDNRWQVFGKRRTREVKRGWEFAVQCIDKLPTEVDLLSPKISFDSRWMLEESLNVIQGRWRFS